jgi:sigma-B regulation protein RsbU (phosphoserine phosphatase)
MQRAMSTISASRGRMRSEPVLPRRRLEHAETWSGNDRTAALVEVPGLTAWVHSVPSDSGARGGDVHYVSVCPNGIVSRIALADVSGHGQAVVLLGERLRDLMLRYLPALEQAGLMRDLNRAVQEELDGVHYATMVAVGWHGPRGLLVLTNAGHPPPCRYRAARREWSWMEGRRANERGRTAGVPLGLLPDSVYARAVLKPEVGDLVLLYTDGVSEALNEAGDELGREGLMSMARAIDTCSAETFGTQLVSALARFRGGARATDDETIIVLEGFRPSLAK